MEGSSAFNSAVFPKKLISAIRSYEESHGLNALSSFCTTSSLTWTRNIEYVVAIANYTDLNLKIQKEEAKYAIHLISDTKDIGSVCYFGKVPFGHQAPPRAIIVKRYEANLEQRSVPLVVYLSWKKECLPIKILVREGTDINEKKILADSILKGDFKSTSAVPTDIIGGELTLSSSNEEKFIDEIYVYSHELNYSRAAITEDGLTCIFFKYAKRNLNHRIYVFDTSEKKWTWCRWTKRLGTMTGDIYSDKDGHLLTLKISGWYYKNQSIKKISQNDWPQWNIVVS